MWSIGSRISDQNHLIDLVFPVHELEQDLYSLISPTTLWPHSIKKLLEIDWSVFECGALNNLFSGAVIVAIYHNLHLNCCFHTFLFQHSIASLKGSPDNFTSFSKRTAHRASCIETQHCFDRHLSNLGVFVESGDIGDEIRLSQFFCCENFNHIMVLFVCFL
jgi:hypothetical protein